MNPQEEIQLGRTGIVLTRLGLGTAPLGGLYQAVDEEDALAVVAGALQRRIRYVDTAPLYGHGLSESRVGRILCQQPRDVFVLSTKVGRLLRPGPDRAERSENPFPDAPNVHPVFDFSYDGTMRSLEESLKRLGLDRVDIVYVHDPDDHFKEALSGAYPALHELRTQGVIRAIGVGMNQAEMLTRFAREADFDCFLLAGRYTLLDQSALAELLPTCAERGIAVVVGGAYNSGVLADPQPDARYNYVPVEPSVLERANHLRAICQSYNVPLKAAALQFPLGHPAVVSVLTGCRSMHELAENQEMFRFPIPPGLWAELQSAGLVSSAAPRPAETTA
jgi:D-threo-aldose 1-dehydrogenase